MPIGKYDYKGENEMFKQMKKTLKNQKGLTLIELLAVIVILGIIAAIAVPSINGIINKSEQDAVKADAIQVLNAAKLLAAAEGPLTGAETWDQDDLDPYVDSVAFNTYVVSLDDTDTTQYAITVTVNDAGGVTLTFTDATIANINADTGTGARTIGQ